MKLPKRPKKGLALPSRCLNILRIGVFGAAHGWWRGESPLPKVTHTYPTIIKLGTVITYLKKIQKTYNSRDIPFDFC